jgi:hypothetical protein
MDDVSAVTTPSPLAAQCARAVCMLRPARFGFNPETARSNHLQRPGADAAADARAGRAEFDAMVAQLRAAGVRVAVLEDEPEPARPDAVFPNNWISFHADGTTVVYPMASPLRRLERRVTAMLEVAATVGHHERRRVDLTGHERDGRFLEGTGSLVLDHPARVAYLARSPRSDEGVAREWCAELGFALEAFDAATAEGASIYHTNVLLWIGEQVVGFGGDWIAAADRARVRERLLATGRELVELRDAQLAAFAGNMLEVQSQAGRVLVMSATAAAALDSAQRATLERHTGPVVVAAVPVIEARGGGSVRCMLAEVP